MAENFEQLNNQNENQLEEKRVEKLETMDFDRKCVEISETISKLASAIRGEESIEKGMKLSKWASEPKDYERIHSGTTAEDWENLKKIWKTITVQPTHVKPSDESGKPYRWITIVSDLMANKIIEVRTLELVDKIELDEKAKKNYMDGRKRLEKLFEEWKFWQELNEAYRILFPFLPKDRLFYKEGK